MRDGHKFTTEESTKEKMSLQGKSDLDQQQLQALTDPETGILRAGLLPQVPGVSTAAAKTLLNQVMEAC